MKNRYKESCSWYTAHMVACSLEPPRDKDGKFAAINRSEKNVEKIERALRNAYHNGWKDGVKDLKEALEEK